MNEPTTARRTATDAARNWNRVAALTAIGLVASSVPYLGCAFSFGLLSGLIVLLVPLYVVFVHVALTVIVVSLLLGRRWLGLAQAAGAVVSVTPAALGDAWYAHAWWHCEHVADRTACLQYLNGSPLLPLGVAGYTLLSLAVLGIVTFVIRKEAARLRTSAA